MRLLLDHHFTRELPELIRASGHDARAALDMGWEAESDDVLLELCARDGLAMLTNNVVDFVLISRRWAESGRRHSGIVFTDDRRWPRSRHHVGALAAAVVELMVANPGPFDDRVHWL